MSQEMELKAKVYARLRRRLWLFDTAFSLALLFGIVAGNLNHKLDLWVVHHVSFWPLQVAVYAGLLGLGMIALTFPLEWTGSFFVEHRFGLSTQTFGQWLWEYMKKLGVGMLMGLLLVEGLAFLLRKTAAAWWIWAALLWMGWSIFLARVAPVWLIPLFYRQKPLADDGLRKRLEALAARCGAHVAGIFEVNLSKSTKKVNACLCGLGATRRVLVSDTLIASYPPEEVEVVLAHEVGHHQLHHIGILIVLEAASTGLSLWWLDRMVRYLLPTLGIQSLGDLAALPVMALGLSCAGLVLMPIVNGISRILEAQADRFALEKSQNPTAFIAAMRRLAQQNLSELSPPRWVEVLLYDHPSIVKRIALAQRYVKT